LTLLVLVLSPSSVTQQTTVLSSTIAGHKEDFVVELDSVMNSLCFAPLNLTQFVDAIVKPIRTVVMLLLKEEPVFNM